jgi:predicted RNase H-like HicB family nuclease
MSGPWETRKGALVNAEEAIQLWIDTAKAYGDVIPEPKGKKLMYA